MSGWYDDGSEEEARMQQEFAQRQIEERRAEAAVERACGEELQRVHELHMGAAEEMFAALHLAVRLIEKERDVLERSFLPEPNDDEAAILTEYEEVTAACKVALAKAGVDL